MKIILALLAFLQLAAYAAEAAAVDPIPAEVTRIVEAEFRVNKEETRGSPYRETKAVAPHADEYFCGYRVRNETTMLNSVYEVYDVSSAGAKYHVSVANRSEEGRIKVNFDSRYVKKSYLGNLDEEGIKQACQSDGWSMSHDKRSKEIFSGGAEKECRSGVLYCRRNDGSYYACDVCSH